MKDRPIEKLHYILGTHAVRLTVDEDGNIQDAERFDRETGNIVRDYKTALRVADHIDADKVEAWQFEHFCDTAKLWD